MGTVPRSDAPTPVPTPRVGPQPGLVPTPMVRVTTPEPPPPPTPLETFPPPSSSAALLNNATNSSAPAAGDNMLSGPTVAGGPLAADQGTPWGVIGGAIGGAIAVIVLLGVVFFVYSRRKPSPSGADADAPTPITLRPIAVSASQPTISDSPHPPPLPSSRSQYGGLPRGSDVKDATVKVDWLESSSRPSVYQPLSISEPDSNDPPDAYQGLPADPSAYGAGEFIDQPNEFVSTRL